MIVFALEGFAAKRREQQDDAIADLREAVQQALSRLGTDEKDRAWDETLLERASDLYDYHYGFVTDTPIDTAPREAFLKSLRKALNATTKESRVDTVSLMIANAAINAATAAAADADDDDIVLEWVTMDDEKVRPAHARVEGQQRTPGTPFNVGGSKMSGPGDVSAPIALWIECRCVLRPTLATEDALTAAADYEGVTHAGLAIVAQDTGAVLMARRAQDDTDDPDVQQSWEFPGGGIDEGEDPQAGAFREFSEEVGYRGFPSEVVDGWRSSDGVYQGFVVHTPTEWDLDEWEPNREVQAIAWFTREMISESAENLRPVVREETDWDLIFGSTGNEDDMDDDAKQIEVPTDEQPVEPVAATDAVQVPWFGVLAPEGVRSGDGRTFLPNSLTHRPLPLPLTYQKQSAGGHDGNVTVGMIEGMGRDAQGLIWGWGNMRSTPDADEAIGLLADFGRFGVSVDADDVALEFNEEDESVEFSKARIAASCIVSIPAFAEAFTSLGLMDPEVLKGLSPLVEEIPDDNAVEIIVPEEELVAAGFADIAPGKTEDGPGWLTHPQDTDRLRDYWVRGPGAAKIGWGTPGDFNRCRVNLAEHIKPQYLNGYCANRHYDALKRWPGQEHSAKDILTDTEPGVALSLVSSAGLTAPAGWFKNPEFKAGDPRLVQHINGEWAAPLTVTPEGRVFGHVAGWKTCHLTVGAAQQICTAPPSSLTDYAYFKTGAVLLDDNTQVATGSLTIAGGHAPERLGARPAMEHYDNSCAAVADVVTGEDEFGIWCAGWVRPGATPEQIIALRASAISGDWRKVGGNLELVGALAVNVPGFGIPRVGVATANGEQVSLVAAGFVPRPEVTLSSDAQVEQMAEKVARRIIDSMAERQKADADRLVRLENLRALANRHH